MTADEADALFLAGLPGAAADLGLGSVLAATAAQAAGRAAAPSCASAPHGSATGSTSTHRAGCATTDSPPFLATVAEAVWTQRRLDVRYERANRAVVERVLEPLGLVLKAGTWYLVARRAGRRPRAAHLPGLARARGGVRDETFEPAGRLRPRSVSGPTTSATTSSGSIRGHRGHPAVTRRTRSCCSCSARSPAPAGTRRCMSEPDADGWADDHRPDRVGASTPTTRCCSSASDVEVLAPAELRDADRRVSAARWRAATGGVGACRSTAVRLGRVVSGPAGLGLPAPAAARPESAAVVGREVVAHLAQVLGHRLEQEVAGDAEHEDHGEPDRAGLRRPRRPWPRHASAGTITTSDPLPHAGEQVVLGNGRVDQRAGQLEVLGRPDLALQVAAAP